MTVYRSDGRNSVLQSTYARLPDSPLLPCFVEYHQLMYGYVNGLPTYAQLNDSAYPHSTWSGGDDLPARQSRNIVMVVACPHGGDRIAY